MIGNSQETQQVTRVGHFSHEFIYSFTLHPYCSPSAQYPLLVVPDKFLIGKEISRILFVCFIIIVLVFES